MGFFKNIAAKLFGAKDDDIVEVEHLKRRSSMAEEDRIEIYGDPNDPSKPGIDDISSKITDSAVTELVTSSLWKYTEA